MTAADYADYMQDLRALLEEIDTRPENFRTLDVHIELAHKGMLFVYETRKKMGETDSIYYARMARTGANKQVSQKTAYDAIAAFTRLNQFVALTGANNDASPIDDHPSCAFSIEFRRTGMEKKTSTRMIFLGFTNIADARTYSESAEGDERLISDRPFRSDRVWEWK